jgi:hypothetical protein
MKFSFTEEQSIYIRETTKPFFTTSLVSYDEDLFHIEKNSVTMILHYKLLQIIS